MNFPEKIYLIDQDPKLIEEWRNAFSDYSSIVEAELSDYFEFPADCMVSPANSFGYMDGGLDRVILYELGQTVQENVQSAIVEKHHGEIPVGAALIVETNSEKWPYLVCAPTMRVPEDVSQTLNAYFAFRAILLEVVRFNKCEGSKKINSIVCSGLATGIGRLSPSQCAVQMKMAFESCMRPTKMLTPKEVYSSHSILKGDV